MGIFSHIAGNKQEKRSAPSPIPDFLLDGSATRAGVSVNEDKALSLSAVWSVINRISNIVASLPFHVYRSTDAGKELISNHPVYKLLHNEPNEYQTPFDFLTSMVSNMLLFGAGISSIEFKSGFPVALNPIHPSKVNVINRDGKLTYKIERDNGTPVIKQPHELLIFRLWPKIDGSWENPIVRFREVLGSALAVREYGASVFGQGINPAGIISGTPGNLDEASQESLIDRFKKYSGLGKSHSLMILQDQEKFERVGIVPQEAQYLESRRFDITEICRIYNVPPHFVFETEKTTSWGSGLSEMSQGFIDYCLAPHLVRIEQEINKKLVAVDDSSFYCKFKVEGLLRSNTTDRIAAYEKAARMGIYTIDDILEMEDRNPIGGKEGQTRLVPANFMPLSKMVNSDKDNQNESKKGS